jgi:hypothetical protein
MFRDESRDSVGPFVRQRGLQAFGAMLTPQAMQAAARAADVSVGRSALDVCTMDWLGVVGAMHTAKDFADELTITWKHLGVSGCPFPKPRTKATRKKCQPKNRCRSKHAPYGNSPQVTEEAFVQARGAILADILDVSADRVGGSFPATTSRPRSLETLSALDARRQWTVNEVALIVVLLFGLSFDGDHSRRQCSAARIEGCIFRVVEPVEQHSHALRLACMEIAGFDKGHAALGHFHVFCRGALRYMK